MKKRSLFLFLITTLILVNSCQRETSFENGSGASEGTLQADGAGDCLPKTVAGAYVVGTALVGTTNYIEVQVNVTKIGSYAIHSDTVNGIYFSASGIFTTTGMITVQLKGNGTPLAAGIQNFIISYGTSGCTIAVTTVSTFAVFTLNGAPAACTGAAVAGTYSVGTALTAANTATINVNVTAVGAYNISTTLSNGMVFTGSGVFTTATPQAVVLAGSGTPTTAGTTNIPVTAGASACNFPVTVTAAPTPATFTVICAAAVINGTYTVGTALTASNTVGITVDVATAGSYAITGTINGMTFSATGTFAAAGAAQPVTLAGTGTPTTAGANTVPLTGGTASCNITVTVGAAAGAATFTANCATAVANGTYTVGTALTAANTISLPVTVTVAGTYTITATLNGMAFSAMGTFASATPQTVTLTGSGLPSTAGPNVVPVTGGTASCNVTVTVGAAAGAATFTTNCATAVVNGTYTVGTTLTAANTISLPVTVTVAGTYTIAATLNGMAFSAMGTFASATPQTVTLTGSGSPTTAGPNVVPVTGGTGSCNITVNVVAATIDYFPRTTNSNWSYESDGDATDSLLIKVIAPTHTALGNTYNIFMSTEVTPAVFDTSGYYRKSGNDYYHYVNLKPYLFNALDNTQRVEFIFLKDNQNVGDFWYTPAFANTSGGLPVNVRIKFTILQKDASISVTTSTGMVSYPNTIVVQEQYEADFGTGWFSLDDQVGFFKDYYSRNKGWIIDEYTDENGVPAGKMDVRRIVVF